MLSKLKLKSEFSYNVLTLMTGTVISQVILIAASPILARIYNPKDFGLYALYMTIASTISVIATGRYEMAILLPKNNNNALNIVALSIILSFLVSFIVLVFIFFFNVEISILLKSPEISSWLYFIPITILLTGVYQSFFYWYNRQKQYRIMSTSRIFQSLAVTITNIQMGLFGFGVSGLIVGGIFGHLLAVIIFVKTIRGQQKKNFNKIKSLKMAFLAKKFINYPKKSAVGAFLNSLSYQAEIILLAMLYSSYYLGMFYFVNKIIQLPVRLFSSSIWQVFLTNSGNSIEDVFFAKFYKQKKIILYSTVPVICSLYMAPDLFILIFGEKWLHATEYILPLVIAMHINFVVASFSLFVIINRPDAEMFFNLFLAFIKIGSIVASYLIWNNAYYTICTFSIAQFISFFILGSWNYRQLNKNIFFFAKMYLPHLVFSICFLFVAKIFFLKFEIWEKLAIYLFVAILHFGIIKKCVKIDL